MRSPIIIVDQKDILIFSTVEKACSMFEADDIDYGILGFDYDGHKLCLQKGYRMVEHRFLFVKWMSNYRSIVIKECYPSVDSSSELKKHLIEFLLQNGYHKEDIEKNNLQDLLNRIKSLINIDMR